MAKNNLKIGDFNELPIVKFVDFGAYLTAGELEILLPQKYIPEGAEIGTSLNVFIYTDSEDRLIATTRPPLAKVGDFFLAEVKDTVPFGAFIEIGVEKHILVPLSEQPVRMEVGNSYVVYIYLDEATDRMVASARLNRFVRKENILLVENQPVSILVVSQTDIGVNVIVENTYMGLVYYSDIFKPLEIGQALNGYVKKIREDGKLDIALKPQGFKQAIGSDTEIILHYLKEHDGFLPLTDKSEPELVYQTLGMSKKSFKKAVGTLYKSQEVTILPEGIKRTSPPKKPEAPKKK